MDYSPRLPLKYETESGNYEMITDPIEEIRQNLKMIVLCSPGDKVGDYLFGAGVFGALFEQNASSAVQKKVSDIYDQVERYLPLVVLKDVEINFETIKAFDVNQNRGPDTYLPGWIVRIYFSVPEFGYEDFLDV
jgi:phage baseplate assembly protein W